MTALACIGARASIESIESASRPEHRARALVWADGIVTASGRNRGLAIAQCGRPAAAVAKDGSCGLVCLRCRDRACPACQWRRSRELGEQLVRVRGEFPGRWVLLTLTQRKVPAAARGARRTADELQHAWRQTFNTRTASGRRIAKLVEGGVKAIEVTARNAGARNRDGSTVRFFGWHVHIHVMLRLRVGARAEQARALIVDEWRRHVDCEGVSQDVRPASDDVARYLCKYVSKGIGQALGRARGRELFESLHGRRLIEGFGAFRGWKAFAPLDLRDPVLIAVQSMGRVWDAPTERVVFVAWERVRPLPSSRNPRAWEVRQVLFELDADDVLAALTRGRAALWGERPLERPPPFAWRATAGQRESAP